MGNRSQGSGPSYLHLYLCYPGSLLIGLEFIGKRPPWGSCLLSKQILQIQTVYLDHCSVYLVRETFPVPFNFPQAENYLLRVPADLDQCSVDTQSPTLQPHHKLILRKTFRPIRRAYSVAEHRKGPSSGDLRVQLPHRPGCGVPRVGKNGLAIYGPGFVEDIKGLLFHIYFPPHLEEIRYCSASRPLL